MIGLPDPNVFPPPLDSYSGEAGLGTLEILARRAASEPLLAVATAIFALALLHTFLAPKILAYKLQERGYDTVEANLELGYPMDLREYGIGAQILTDLGLHRIRLLTNNPRKLVGLEGYGLEIVGQVPIRVAANQHNKRYLRTKREKLGHLL